MKKILLALSCCVALLSAPGKGILLRPDRDGRIRRRSEKRWPSFLCMKPPAAMAFQAEGGSMKMISAAD